MYTIINRYCARAFIVNLLIITALIVCVLLLFDFIELVRITSSRNIPITTVLEMSVYKVPIHIQKIFGFLVLIASLVTYSRFNRSSELVIFKVSGLSIWQIAFPSVVAACLIGIFVTTVLNPISSNLTRKYQKMEAVYLKGNPSLMSISKTGLWIKQQNEDDTESVIHALRIVPNDMELHDVTFYIISDSTGFIKRIDADTAKLYNGYWMLKNAYSSSAQEMNAMEETLVINTSITFEQIQENMIAPESISFWKLPSFIAIAESSGLSVIKHKLYFYKLLVLPLFFVAAAVLGVAFSISNGRNQRMNANYFICLAIGFLIYFLSDLFFALSVSGSINPLIASSAPTVIMLGVGLLILLQLEEMRY